MLSPSYVLCLFSFSFSFSWLWFFSCRVGHDFSWVYALFPFKFCIWLGFHHNRVMSLVYVILTWSSSALIVYSLISFHLFLVHMCLYPWWIVKEKPPCTFQWIGETLGRNPWLLLIEKLNFTWIITCSKKFECQLQTQDGWLPRIPRLAAILVGILLSLFLR